MTNYIYDGTFEGLLTVIAGSIQSAEEINCISSGGEHQPDLFAEIKFVPTDSILADCFFRRLSSALSKEILMDIAYCYLSEEPGMEKVIAEYIKLLFAEGRKGDGNYLNDTVFKIKRVSDKVAHEIGRLHGFIRFRKLASGIYYAPVEPDYNVVQFLAPHFTARFTDQKWMIHDLKRKTGIYYNGSRCIFLPGMEIAPEVISNLYAGLRAFESGSTSVHAAQSYVLDNDEMTFQALWDQYFKQIAIAERRNKRLQRQRMPVRYWKYLVEDVRESN